MPPIESHLATVVDPAADPEKAFAISVQIDSLLPEEIYPELALPLFPSNLIKIPKSGEIVECITLAPFTSPEFGEPGEEDLGPEEFPEFLFWTGRIFDLKEGKPPSELITNYPKRTGWWTDDGSIIYMDDKEKEIALVLAGGSTFIRMKNNGIQIQHGGQKVVLEDDRVHIDATRVNLGSEPALEALLKGTFFTNVAQVGSMAKFLTDWSTAAIQFQTDLQNLLANPPVNPDTLAQKTKDYVDALVSHLAIVLGGIVSWISTKIFLDA